MTHSLWWLIRSELGDLFPIGLHLIELYRRGDNGLRKYTLDGNGKIWLPSTEGNRHRKPPHPAGRLLAIVADRDETTMRTLLEQYASGKEICIWPANKPAIGGN